MKTPLQKLIEKEGYKKLIKLDGFVWWREDLVEKAIKIVRKDEARKSSTSNARTQKRVAEVHQRVQQKKQKASKKEKE